jgi:hypothetical protein
MAAADHAHDFKTCQGRCGGFHPLEAARRPDHALERAMIRFKDVIQSWLGKFGQRDKWSFCLRAARMAAEQEKR